VTRKAAYDVYAVDLENVIDGGLTASATREAVCALNVYLWSLRTSYPPVSSLLCQL